ncbi:MAG TPA: hypothetical protein VGZ02_04440 [Candidatus Baltobacteraceae bacterium]|jgi:hypothetical protein|nr:hypothetical protein [Candidatus Baltobacteraceae bacterium]
MRINANAPMLPVWRSDADLQRIVSPETLAVARVEPVFTRREQGALGLDLVFVRESEIAVIPAIRIAHEMLLEPECSPFIWPHCAKSLDAPRVSQIEEFLVPWLRARALTGQMNDELVRNFSDALDPAAFELARKACFIGAATYRDVAIAAAPYVYAMRFARNAGVGSRDAAGATGSMLLAQTAASVQCDLQDPAVRALAARWFGSEIFQTPAGRIDVGIGIEADGVEIRFDEAGRHVVTVATPVPSEFVVSFDPEDAAPCRTFSVTCKQQTVLRSSALPRVPAAVGGSGGRIAIVAAASAINERGAIADDANELARRLNAEGFTAHVLPPASVRLDTPYDLVHAFDVGRDSEFGTLLKEARRRSIPVVATAGLADATGEWSWASQVVNALMRSAQDEITLSDHLRMMSLRRLNTEQTHSFGGDPLPGYADSVRAALSAVDVLLVTGAYEEQLARERFGYSGPARTVPAYLNDDSPGAPIDDLCGTWDFVFVHAAIVPNANLMLLARAAQELDLPLLIAGPVTDSLYFAHVREALDGRTIFVPHPSADQVAALYRRARVYADLAWWQSAVHRAARAAVNGCGVLVAQTSPAAALWPGGVACADPSDVASIRAGLSAAWQTRAPAGFALEVSSLCDPGRAFVETVTAYAQAQSACAASLPAPA